MDNVSASVTPIADDRLSAEFGDDELPEVVITIRSVTKLMNFLKARGRAHELEDRVDR